MCFADCVRSADGGAYFSPLVHFHFPSRPVENYTQPCFVCKDTSLAQGNFICTPSFLLMQQMRNGDPGLGKCSGPATGTVMFEHKPLL